MAIENKVVEAQIRQSDRGQWLALGMSNLSNHRERIRDSPKVMRQLAVSWGAVQSFPWLEFSLQGN
jgi:hypothetical protein